MSDQKAFTGTNRASYHAREPIQNNKERLAMRQGDVFPPVPERVDNPRIREDRTVQDVRQNSEKMLRATAEDAYTEAWFDCCRSVFPQSVSKAGPDVNLFFLCQRTASSSATWVSSTGKVKFGKLRISISRFLQMKGSTLPTILTCRFSENSGETTTRM